VALLDIRTGQAREILNGVFSVSPSSLSPNRQGFVYQQSIQGKTSLFLHSFSSPEEKTMDLQTDRHLIGWSPDSQWIAVQAENGEVSVLHPDGSAEHLVLTVAREDIVVRWFFDSQHLLVTEHSFDMNANRDGVVLSIVSIQDGNVQPIEIPGLNKENFLIDDLFWQGEEK
jgi:Tol biopolymer transport system component